MHASWPIYLTVGNIAGRERQEIDFGILALQSTVPKSVLRMYEDEDGEDYLDEDEEEEEERRSASYDEDDEAIDVEAAEDEYEEKPTSKRKSSSGKGARSGRGRKLNVEDDD